MKNNDDIMGSKVSCSNTSIDEQFSDLPIPTRPTLGKRQRVRQREGEGKLGNVHKGGEHVSPKGGQKGRREKEQQIPDPGAHVAGDTDTQKKYVITKKKIVEIAEQIDI